MTRCISLCLECSPPGTCRAHSSLCETRSQQQPLRPVSDLQRLALCLTSPCPHVTVYTPTPQPWALCRPDVNPGRTESSCLSSAAHRRCSKDRLREHSQAAGELKGPVRRPFPRSLLWACSFQPARPRSELCVGPVCLSHVNSWPSGWAPWSHS